MKIGTQIFFKSERLNSNFVGEIIKESDKAVKVEYAHLTDSVEIYLKSVWIPKSLITTDSRFESTIYIAKPFFGNQLFPKSFREPISEYYYNNGKKVYC